MIDSALEIFERVACPDCRARLRPRHNAWSCACGLVFPMAFWWARDGELFPTKR